MTSNHISWNKEIVWSVTSSLVIGVFGQSDGNWLGVRRCQLWGNSLVGSTKKFYRFAVLKFYSIAEIQYFVFE